MLNSRIRSSTADLTYRADIDGLRAVAVLLVILFHAKLSFTGGFVGVDVFFVISGYLITGLILKRQHAGTFRMADFWGRRIRRILPAACVMVFITLVAGMFLLFSTDRYELGMSAVAQQLMLSNFYFWQHTDYFAGPSELKPLLHTWSLAVEEQFYLAYPFLLTLLVRSRPRAVAGALAAVALASLALSELGLRYNPSATFFLLPTRAWELLLGGLLCFAPPLSRDRQSIAQFLGIVGITMIVAAATCFDSETRFPGAAALLPCLGAALVIYSNAGRLTWVGRLLIVRPMVGLGLISYSLYLWHWPLFAFARYWLGENLPAAAGGIVIAVSLLLAYLSWRYVEMPFRERAVVFRRPVWIALGAMIPTVFACSLLLMMGLGSGGPASEKAERYLAARNSKAYTRAKVKQGKLPCFGDKEGGIKCLVWGDSHAMAIMPGMNAACQSLRVRGFQATHSSTPPILDLVCVERCGLNERAPAFNRFVVDFAIAEGIDVAVLCGAWHVYARNPEFEPRLEKTIDELNAAGVAVVVVLDYVRQEEDVPIQLAKRAFWGLPTHEIGVPLDMHRSRNEACNAIINRVARGKAMVLDPIAALVDERDFCPAEMDGVVLYRDKSHLSIEGGMRLRGHFEKMFEELELSPTSDNVGSEPRIAARHQEQRGAKGKGFSRK